MLWQQNGCVRLADVVAHVHDIPVAPSQRSGIPLPSSLERAILSCIAKSPADRPANAEALFSMLAACTDAGSWTPEPAEACGGDGWYAAARLCFGRCRLAIVTWLTRISVDFKLHSVGSL